MVTICRDWIPTDGLYACNSFDADITMLVEVNRDGEMLDSPNNGDNPNDPHSCNDHGHDIEETSNARGINTYEDIAWSRGFGFCPNCWMATREIDNYECDDCGDTNWPYGEDPDEEDDEEETTADQAAAFIRARQPRTPPARRTSRIHALSIPHGA